MSMYIELIRIRFLMMLAYRTNYYSGILIYSINIGAYYFLWSAIYGGKDEIQGLSVLQMTTYVAVAWMARAFYFNNIDREIAAEIQEGKALIQTAWLSGAKYEKGSGMVELTFSSYLKPYMLKLNTMFTQYKLANILSMKSKYSPRIYELLKCNEFKKQGYIEIEIEDLRKLLKAENVYPKYNDFKRYIIERTQKELKKISDINFEFEEIKTGRKVTSLKFYIHSNKSRPINKPTALEEISATTTEPESKETFKGIEQIVNLMADKNISPSEAIKIYKSGNGDMDNIAKVYNYCKNKETDNFVGYIIKMVKPGEFVEPKKNSNKNNFNSFEQRNYDFDDLERKLLGWDKEVDEDGQEYEQARLKIGDE